MIHSRAKRYSADELIPDLRALARNAFIAGYNACAQHQKRKKK
jgi:hypothetical protein